MVGDVGTSPPLLTIRPVRLPSRRDEKISRVVGIMNSWISQPETALVLVVVCSRQEVEHYTAAFRQDCVGLRGVRPEVRNKLAATPLEREAVRKSSERAGSRGIFVVTRTNGGMGINYPACTHVFDNGEMFEHVTCPLTIARFMRRVPVDAATLRQSAGRCGRHTAGLCLVSRVDDTLPRIEDSRPLHAALRNENAADLMLQFDVADLLTLPECFRPSEFQVAGALIELSMMGVLDECGLVLEEHRIAARKGNGGGRLNLARKVIRAEDAATLEIVAALADGGFDPEEVLPGRYFSDEEVSNGRLDAHLRSRTDILSVGLRMGEKLSQLVADTASREYSGSSRLKTRFLAWKTLSEASCLSSFKGPDPWAWSWFAPRPPVDLWWVWIGVNAG